MNKFTLNQKATYIGDNPGPYEHHVPSKGTKGRIAGVGKGTTYDFKPDGSEDIYIIYERELK